VKCSDDGEPSQTAGKPILYVLESQGLSDVILIVTRYFGGIKLGAGGITRAYSKAAGDCVLAANIIEKRTYDLYRLIMSYSLLDTVKNFIKNKSYSTGEETFLESVSIEVFVPETESESFEASITALSNATVQTQKISQVLR
jgi:putative IMPACT (imprinted ancient) family translation regulator